MIPRLPIKTNGVLMKTRYAGQRTIETRSRLYALYNYVKFTVYGLYGIDLKRNWTNNLDYLVDLILNAIPSLRSSITDSKG